MGSGVSVEVLTGVKVSVGEGRIVGVDVNSEVGVKLSVAGRLVDVEAGCGNGEADVASGTEVGACPLWERLQAVIIRIKKRERKKFLIFML